MCRQQSTLVEAAHGVRLALAIVWRVGKVNKRTKRTRGRRIELALFDNARRSRLIGEVVALATTILRDLNPEARRVAPGAHKLYRLVGVVSVSDPEARADSWLLHRALAPSNATYLAASGLIGQIDLSHRREVDTISILCPCAVSRRNDDDNILVACFVRSLDLTRGVGVVIHVRTVACRPRPCDCRRGV